MSKLSRNHTQQILTLSLKRILYRTIWCSRLSHTRQVSSSRQTPKNRRHRNNQIPRSLRKVVILLRAMKRAPMKSIQCKRAHLVRHRILRLKKMWVRSFIRPISKSLFRRLTKVSSRITLKNCQLNLFQTDLATVKLNTFVNLLTKSGKNMMQTTVARLTKSKPRTS